MGDWLWQWRERFRRLIGARRGVEREIFDEMQFHLEMETKQNLDRGMTEAEARRAARLEFGSVEKFRAEARETRWGHWFDVLFQDLRYGIRMLVRSPGFTVVALLTLALGIGATTAVFSLVDSVLFRALPYPETDRSVWIQTSWAGKPRANISPAEYLDYRERLGRSFEHVGVYAINAVNVVIGEDHPQRWRAAALTPGVLPALGITPMLGRNFTEEEELAAANVVLLAGSTWRDRFASNPEIVGRTLRTNGVDAEIIGVLPTRFRLPEDFFSGQVTELYFPHGIDPSQVSNRGSHYLSGVGRLRSGVGVEVGSAAVESVAAAMVDEYPEDYQDDMRFRATAIPIAEIIRGQVRTPLVVLAGAVAFILLITCTNVANLLLSRVDRRQRELALRAAIGAGRGRIAVQVAVENLLLAFAGGVFGLLLASATIRGLEWMAPLELPWLTELSLDARMLAIACGLSLLTALLFGAIPAARGTAENLVVSLGSGSRNSAGVGAQRVRASLAVTEIALALVLLTGAGLLARSFERLLEVDPGFRTENLLTIGLALPAAHYDETKVLSFFEQLEQQVESIPGVRSAGAVTNLPLASRLGDMDFEIEGRSLAAGELEPSADWQVVTPGYAETMGLTLERGRWVDTRDRADSVGVVVVNSTFAQRHWPDDDPIGRRFRLLGDGTRPEIAEVIGMVGDVRHEGLDQASIPQMYFAHQQFRFWGSGRPARSLTLAVHSQLGIVELEEQVARTIRQIDPALPLSNFRTMTEVRSEAVAMPRLLTIALGVFSTIALLLAAIGVYGAMAEGVAKRIPELGIRLALGANPSEVSLLVVREGLRLTFVGVIIGLTGALLLTRTLASLLFETSPTDVWTFSAVTLLLVATAVFACWSPVRRASRIDPAQLLRAE